LGCVNSLIDAFKVAKKNDLAFPKTEKISTSPHSLCPRAVIILCLFCLTLQKTNPERYSREQKIRTLPLEKL
jgi:hypothetical protein